MGLEITLTRPVISLWTKRILWFRSDASMPIRYKVRTLLDNVMFSTCTSLTSTLPQFTKFWQDACRVSVFIICMNIWIQKYLGVRHLPMVNWTKCASKEINCRVRISSTLAAAGSMTSMISYGLAKSDSAIVTSPLASIGMFSVRLKLSLGHSSKDK